jgi:hypothetical protein
MKKVLVKKKVIDIPYSPALGEAPEILEVSHLEVIREFQSEDADLAKMLSMEAPGAIIEVIDITAEYAAKEKEKKDKKDKEDTALAAAKALDFSKDMNAKELTAAMKVLLELLKAKGIL